MFRLISTAIFFIIVVWIYNSEANRIAHGTPAMFVILFFILWLGLIFAYTVWSIILRSADNKIKEYIDRAKEN